MNLVTKQKQSYRCRNQPYGYQGEGSVMEEDWGESLGLIDANLHTGWKNKVLLYSTGNYIQYPMINHDGKDYEK